METYKKHNYKLSEEDKKQIMVEYTLNRRKENIDTLCNRFDISKTTLYDIVKSKQGQEILNRHITESKRNFTKKLDLILEKTYDKLNEALDTQDIRAKDLAIIGATTYDKSRLENNLSTSNNNININIKVEK